MLDSLNQQQKEAVLHKNGPLLIFAGAGSGKTRVITFRIARLILDKVVQPENILAVTFTRKAAGEMKERVQKLLKESSENWHGRLPFIGTFHSFGANFLRKEGRIVGLPYGFSIFDPDDVVHLIKQIMDERNIDKKQFNPNVIYTLISSAKNEKISPEEYPNFVRGPLEDIVAEIYPEYEKNLRSQNAVDFDDLQILPLKILDENKDIREKYHKMYKYVLVDEYQDTNMIQYQLIKHLVNEDKNICVVGDDDQGIYSWRGATIKNILSFEKDFPGAKVIKLEKNYRSTRNILHAAHSVISQNIERAQKDLWTDSELGEKIVLYQARDGRDEAEFVVSNIMDIQSSGGGLNDIVVLYRTNAQSRAIEEILINNAIPYKLIGGVRFYERREIKDMLAYLRFLANPKDETSLVRIMNVPTRKIGEKSLSEMKSFAKKFSGGKFKLGECMLILWAAENNVKNIEKFLPESVVKSDVIENAKTDDSKDFYDKYKKVIDVFGQLYDISITSDARHLIDEILELTKYETWIDDGTEQAQSRKENLYELKVVANRYSKLGPKDSMMEFLSDVALVEQDSKDDGGQYGDEMVTLMTLHSAKGLEFEMVFMIGMEEGLFPHIRSFTSPSELEEERRLCYVGITRAKKRLFLTYAENRSTYGGFGERIPSRFIAEVPPDLVDFCSSDGGY
ncbi:MAG: UvrD-helicase domain-containing protein [bacterium]